MSKKWKPAYIPRPPEAVAPVEIILGYNEITASVALPPIPAAEPIPATMETHTSTNRYKAVHKAFNSRTTKDGQIISWEVEMDEYINRFARENNATLHTVAQAAVFTNYLFIWEMPCP